VEVSASTLYVATTSVFSARPGIPVSNAIADVAAIEATIASTIVRILKSPSFYLLS
jgi:hypothetical protein